MKKIWIVLALLQLTYQLVYAQQDAQFSQYMFNGIYINPAYAGYKEQLNVSTFYRNQWTGITGSPKTMSAAVDAIANDGNVGLAFEISNDKLGAQRNMSAYVNYAYRIRMNADGSSRLSLGLGAGFVQLGINGALLNPNDIEVNQPLGIQSSIVPDARTGVYFSNNQFYAGLSVDNLVSQYINRAVYTYIPKPKPQFYLTAGTLVPISEDMVLKPSFLIKDDRAGPTSLDLDVFLIIGDRFWIGGAYRTGIKLYNKPDLQADLTNLNSAVGAVQIFATENLRIGYAYDFSVGPLQGYSGGTHEISLTYYFPRKKERMLTPRYF